MLILCCYILPVHSVPDFKYPQKTDFASPKEMFSLSLGKTGTNYWSP